MDKIIEYTKKEKIGDIKENVSFRTLTTYKVGGIAKLVILPLTIEKLITLLKYLDNNHIKYYILGNGSNVLASEKDYDGVIVKLTKIDYVKRYYNKHIVGAGCSLVKFANQVCKDGYSGMEFACGIPGTVGGAIYMNAGAYNSSISNVLVEAKFLNEKKDIIVLTKADLDFSYRHSLLQNNKHLICVEATFLLKKGDKDTISNLVESRRQRRLDSQPLSFPSAGSVFRNPYGLYAGKLIEDAGLKGKMIGGAKISDKHSNFIINYEKASPEDIKRLMDLAKKEVKNKYNIDLKIEQELLNWE